MRDTPHSGVQIGDSALVAERWLGSFQLAVNQRDAKALGELFAADGCWRDVLAFTWDLSTFEGRQRVTRAWEKSLRSHRFGTVDIQPASRCEYSEDYGRPVLQVIFEFTHELGRCQGVVRLLADPGLPDAGRAWTLVTVVEEVHGAEGHGGARRPKHAVTNRVFGGPNWLDERMASRRYDGRDPQVLIVGSGQAGLSLAARLGQLDVDALVVDRHDRVGDNWRKRYHSLTLHNEVWSNHLPYMPFPDTWPVYIPKDKLANWFESYVDAMELNVWTGTEFLGGGYDTVAQRWSLGVRSSEGAVRTMRPRHVVIATGVSSIPNIPSLPGLEDFIGPVLHTTAYSDGAPYRGQRVLVVGTGNSGHDVALDLYHSGAAVVMMQRSPTTVVSLEPSAHRFYAGYSEDRPTDESDLLHVSVPYPLMVQLARRLTEEACVADREILEGLRAIGFKMDLGEDLTGWQFKYLRRGGGYYINVGCSDLLAEGKIGLCQFDEIARFVAGGVRFRDGSVTAFDACILATGYKDMQTGVRALFGDGIADRVGPVWGFDEQGELSNVWKRTPQDGLWFMMGSITQCRVFSKYLALQIWAAETGTLDGMLGDAGKIRV